MWWCCFHQFFHQIFQINRRRNSHGISFNTYIKYKTTVETDRMVNDISLIERVTRNDIPIAFDSADRTGSILLYLGKCAYRRSVKTVPGYLSQICTSTDLLLRWRRLHSRNRLQSHCSWRSICQNRHRRTLPLECR